MAQVKDVVCKMMVDPEMAPAKRPGLQGGL